MRAASRSLLRGIEYSADLQVEGKRERERERETDREREKSRE
jgi:hypothetical protein